MQLFLKRKLMTKQLHWDSDYDQKKLLENYFRHWQKLINLDVRRTKLARCKAVFKKLQSNIQTCKLQAFYRWVYKCENMKMQETSGGDGNPFQNFHAIINFNLIKTQSEINSSIEAKMNIQKAKYKKIRARNLMEKLFSEFFKPQYRTKVCRYFQKWKVHIVSQQKFELKCLDMAKDILVDEL